MKRTFISCLLLLIINLAYAQWPVIYYDEINLLGTKVVSTYDQGFLILGNDNGNYCYYSKIIKIDVNGNVIWAKTIKDNIHQFMLLDIEVTPDGGFITIGETTKYDSQGDPIIIKFNSCGETDWCKVISSLGTYNSGQAIRVIDDGYLALIRYYGNDVSNKRIFLFRLDEAGEIVWHKVYAQNDPLIWNEEGYGLLVTANGNYIITGACEYPTISGGDTSTYLSDRPYFIYIDSTGNEIWDLKWGIEQYSFGLSWQSIEKEPGWFYSACGYATEGIPTHPVLFKYDESGNQKYQKYLIDEPDLVGGGAETFEVFNDTNLIIGYHWRDTYYPVDYGYSMVMKTDTMGNVITDRLLVEQNRAPEDIEITHDNKIIVVGSYYLDSNWDTYLWKMNANLEDDSIYTAAYTYDSLCPHNIVSDTMDCNCTVVGLEEIINGTYDKTSWIYPNPAKESINLKLFAWKDIKNKKLEIFSMQGLKIVSENIPDKLTGFSIKLPETKPGLYVVVLSNDNFILEREKLLINE